MSRRTVAIFIAALAVLIVVAAVILTRGVRGGLFQGSAEAAAAPQVARADFAAVRKASGVRFALGDPFDSVVAKLGQPTEEHTVSASTGGSVIVMEASYPDIGFQYAQGDGTILAIELKSQAYATPRGITVGSSVKQVTRAYGPPPLKLGGNLQYVATVSQQLDQYQLSFVLSRSRIKEIWLFIQVQ